MALFATTDTLGVRISTDELWGEHNSVHNRWYTETVAPKGQVVAHFDTCDMSQVICSLVHTFVTLIESLHAPYTVETQVPTE